MCECTEDEIPLTFKKGGSSGLGNEAGQCTEDPKGVVDRTLETKGFQGWTENDNPWTSDDESSDGRLSAARPSVLVITRRSTAKIRFSVPVDRVWNLRKEGSHTGRAESTSSFDQVFEVAKRTPEARFCNRL